MTVDRDRPDLRESLARQRVVAVVRQSTADDARRAARGLLDAGLRVIEVSCTTPGALDVVAELARETAGRPDVLIGAGTVLDLDTVHRAAARGARFILSPVLDEAVVSTAHALGLAAVPGCATPTEMRRGMTLGAAAVKIFPASTWHPAALRDLLSAMPNLPCVPTGGIAVGEASAWLAAGAVAVGLGSGLAAPGAAEAARRLAATPSTARRGSGS